MTSEFLNSFSKSVKTSRTVRVHYNTKKTPQVGFEPTTTRLTVARSTTELLRNHQKVNDKRKGKRGNVRLSHREALHYPRRSEA